MIREDGRECRQLRPVKMTKDYIKWPEGSVLIEVGNTCLLYTSFGQSRGQLHYRDASGGQRRQIRRAESFLELAAGLAARIYPYTRHEGKEGKACCRGK